MASASKRARSRPNFMNDMLDDIYHPEKPICKILPTGSTRVRKNVFTQYRPRVGTCDDYNISLTEVKMDAGATKIHVQRTEAKYMPYLADSPPPPPQKRTQTKYFSGGPPQWEFQQEVYQRKMLERQRHYHAKFAERIAQRKKAEKEFVRGQHRAVMALSGPEWFQELSPKQLRVVDDLRNCIVKDFAEGDICHSRENIAQLGLVLRPNHRHVEHALRNCCKCPVEFLLILYQLINPTRKKYSINDRLLLSAVVHLTMRETLRELHVRIPSPPPPAKVTKSTPKRKPRIKYASPYLQPYALEKEPPKFSGVYYNKHLQHPESPYFSYLEDFRKGITSDGDRDSESKSYPKTDTDKEIDTETTLAQSLYEQLVDYKPVPRLQKPSRYRQCHNFWTKLALPLTIPPKIPTLSQEEITCICKQDKKTRRKLKKRTARFKDDVFVVGGVVDQPDGPILLITGLQPKTETPVCTCAEDMLLLQRRRELVSATATNEQKYIMNGVVITPEGPIFAVSGVQPDIPSEAELLQRREELVNSMVQREPKFVIEGVVNRREGPIFLISRVVPEEEEVEELMTKESEMECCCGARAEKLMAKNNREEMPVQKDEDKMMTKSGRKCYCPKRADEVTMAKMREDMVSNMINQKRKFVIEGVVNRPDGPVFIISRVMLEREEDKVLTKSGRKCPCGARNDEARMERKREEMVNNMINQEKKFVIEGVVNRPDGPVFIISRVMPSGGKTCTCMYQEEEEETVTTPEESLEDTLPHCNCKEITKRVIEKPLCQCERCQEDRKKKTMQLVIQRMKEVNSQEVIPVIDAVITEQPCKCLEQYQQRVAAYESYQRRKGLVKLTTEQKDRFVVGGVVNTPDGPVMVHEGIQPKLECGCGEAARKRAEMERHLARMPHPPPGRIKHGIAGVKETPEGNVFILDNTLPIADCHCMEVYKKFTEAHSTCLELYETYMEQVKENLKEFESEMLPCSDTGDLLAVHQSDNDEVDDDDDLPTCTVPETETCTCQKKVCSCEKLVTSTEPTCDECTCGVLSTEGKEEESSEDEEEEDLPSPQQSLKRFFINKKISCSRKWQEDVLKRALKSMADDGFPLAKLPHCDRLPHFRLWMQMRCGKTWTQEQKSNSVLVSKMWWRHVDTCRVRTIKRPTLGVSKKEAAMLDWSKAQYVRELANTALTSFYRRLQQTTVELGREFFPTMFDYPFPFHTFRDCYFAYVPSKEEDVQSKFVWQRFEYKNMADRRCYC